MQFFPVLPIIAGSSSQTRSTTDTSSASSFGGLLNRLGNQAETATRTTSGTISNARTMLLGNNGMRDSILRDKLLKSSGKETVAEGGETTLVDVPTLRSLKNKLRGLGVSDDTLEDLETAASEGGLTWSNLLTMLGKDSAFSGKNGVAASLDDATRNGTDLLFQKLGFSSDESDSLLANLEKGDLSKTWKAVLDKIAGLSKDASVSITQDDLSNLGKAMQLDQDGIKRMQQLLAGKNGTELKAADLKALLAEISNSISQKQSEADERLAGLRDVLAPAMDQAWERNGGLAASNARASKDSAASQALIKDSATAAANGFAHSAASAAGHKDVPHEAPGKHSKEAGTDENGNPIGETDRTLQQNDKYSILKGKNGNDGNGQPGANDAKNAGADAKRKAESKAFLDRITVELAQPTSGTGQQNTTQNAAQALNRNTQQRVFEQVESGMLKTMQNGARQLTLQLTPEDLGKVTVILSVRNNEVNAMIRPESAEAAKAINDQLHQLRASLENQGLKVDNIDVQTGLQNSLNDKSWQGTGEHNANQEMQQKFLNQRRLHGMRAGDSGLAQEMHNVRETANTAPRSGLDIIA